MAIIVPYYGANLARNASHNVYILLTAAPACWRSRHEPEADHPASGERGTRKPGSTGAAIRPWGWIDSSGSWCRGGVYVAGPLAAGSD